MEISHPLYVLRTSNTITEQTTLSREWTSSSETSSPVTLAVFSNLTDTVVELQSRGTLAGKDGHDQRNDSPPCHLPPKHPGL